MMRETRRISGSMMAAVLMAAGLFVVAGCTLPGFVASVIPKTIHPLYVLEDVNTLVLVDDPGRALNSRQDASLVAETVAVALRREGVVTRFVEPREVETLRLNHADFDTWSLTRIGREVGAEQIIEVRVTGIALRGQNAYVQPLASAEIKVFDPMVQKRMFPNPNHPADSAGHPVTASHFFQDSSVASGTDPATLKRQIGLKLAETTAKLFYKHLQEDESTAGVGL